MFITFEGGEGAGKSTLLKKVAESLEKEHRVLVTREPGGTQFGEEMREFLLHRKEGMQVCEKAELFLFEAARAQHVEEVILPALKDGKVVLCDRYSDSTIAYQGMGRGLGMDYVKEVDRLATGGLIPTLTLFVDIDPKLGLLRAKNRSNTVDRMESEKLAFHERVRQGFLSLAENSQGRMVILNGELSQEALFEEAMKYVRKAFLQG